VWFVRRYTVYNPFCIRQPSPNELILAQLQTDPRWTRSMVMKSRIVQHVITILLQLYTVEPRKRESSKFKLETSLLTEGKKIVISHVMLYIIIQDVYKVLTPYISETVQNYEKPREICVRSFWVKSSFKRVIPLSRFFIILNRFRNGRQRLYRHPVYNFDKLKCLLLFKRREVCFYFTGIQRVNGIDINGTFLN